MKALARLTALSFFWAGTAAAQQPPPETTWNIWTSGRLVGVVDRAVSQQTFGSYATLGADKKVSPWLTLGMGLGYEHLVTQNWVVPGTGSIENGVGLQPYATAQLSPNLFLTPFAALTRVSYDASLGSGVGAQFQAWRWLVGGALTGVWHEDHWRLQPAFSIVYGQENQEGYTTTAGAPVAPTSLPFGRMSAGPEIGYAFVRQGAWAIEPFVLARANYDYVQSSVTVFNGTSFSSALHGPVSASLGAGVSINTRENFYLRLQASNESVAQSGLEVWLGEVRGGWKF